MPVHKITHKGQICYRWGTSGKIYCGVGARANAERQGRAAYAQGYKGRKK